MFDPVFGGSAPQDTIASIVSGHVAHPSAGRPSIPQSAEQRGEHTGSATSRYDMKRTQDSWSDVAR